jgi:radical SAM superfamily enzyme YgiQ (UPF0313 family)
MKKVLFINPGIAECGVPHAGLATLGAVLKQRGHTVKVADYHFSSQTPRLEDILEDFKPDLAGISLFSSMVSVADELIEAVKNHNIPLICGGPHASSYHEKLSTDTRFDYIVVGEAESIIVDTVESAMVNKTPRLIHAPIPDINKLPLPDYFSFYNYENMNMYPIITSRGCPFNCSFCTISLSNSKKWRTRSLDDCIEELRKVKSELPNVKEVMIWDDNFSLNIKRAKSFLQMLLNEKFEFKMRLANVRADKIDKEFLLLLKECGCEEVQFGVEHGNPEVFGHVGKGETLDDIRQGAKLVNECGMKLGCSLIIGLPHDNLKRTLDSIKFVKELKADHVHWNILVPYRGTRAYKYFKEHGHVDDSSIPMTLPQNVLSFEPNADTHYFTREDRKKAYLMALLLSGDDLLLHDVKRTFSKVLTYNLLKEILQWTAKPKILKGLAWTIKERMSRIKK